MNNNRTFGIEIEFVGERWAVADAMRDLGLLVQVESYNHETRPHWKLTTDSSCGSELVSPILKGEDGVEQLRLACQALQSVGVRVNKSCGVHIHHDINDYELKHAKNLFLMYAKMEKVIDQFMPPSRRGSANKFCKSFWQNPYDMYGDCNLYSLESKIEKVKRARNLEQIGDAIGSRYYKLNFQAYVKYGTIEFRQHSGSIEFEKIYNWLVFSQNMVEVAKIRNMNFQYNPNWDTLPYLVDVLQMRKSQGASDDVIEALKYYRKRMKKFAACA